MVAAVVVAGREFSACELERIIGLVSAAETASRFALARRVCEEFAWKRASGSPKTRECRDLLEEMERRGWMVLPAKGRRGRPRGRRTAVPLTLWGVEQPRLECTLKTLGAIELRAVAKRRDHAFWRELVGRYHYLGATTAFGAKLRYLVVAPGERPLGCLQYSSAAWRLAPRDRWIGWTDARRKLALGRVVQQSRFLILPWVAVPNLASHILSHSRRVLAAHWSERYGGVEPVLIETLVDPERYRGTSYRAANWIEVGQSTGRGRMDRHHQRHGAAPKRVFVCPLVGNARQILRG